jgi:hypothetical protein
MNDIKEKEQLPIVPLATLLLSRESGRTYGRTRIYLNAPPPLKWGHKIIEPEKRRRYAQLEFVNTIWLLSRYIYYMYITYIYLL